jgi:hypothetical protein
MITDYEKILRIGQPWPPNDQDTKERLARYERAENLFEGKHGEVWRDEIRKLRGDGSGEIRLVLNYFKRLSLLWADLTCGEAPDAKADEKQAAQVEALARIIQYNSIWSVVGDAVIDLSKFGDAPFKVRYQEYGIIENIPPEYWFPIVESSNIKQAKAHLLAYEFEGPEDQEAAIQIQAMVPASMANRLTEAQIKAVESGQVFTYGKTSYLKVEIHTVGKLEHRLYRLRDKKIESQLELSQFPDYASLQAVEDTGLDDFAVLVVHNITSTKKYHGMDDYTDIADIVRELEWRYAQVFRIEDKFSDPSMYGPPIEEQDPRDGEFRVMGGSRYITLTEGQSPPGMLTWDGQLPANFEVIGGPLAGLMQRLYEISETCKVAFDASAGGQGLSAQALRIMLLAPLKKANRIQGRMNPIVQQLIRLVSMLERHMGMAGAVVVENVAITWHDGMPKDDAADAQRDSTLVTGKVRSAPGLMREKGMSEDQINQEKMEMAEQVL